MGRRALGARLERWYQTQKNRILLENSILPSDLEAQIQAFVDYYTFSDYTHYGYAIILNATRRIWTENMSATPIQIQNCQEFWENIVQPDYNDFQTCTSDLRLAFHCSISLFHMCDWVYVDHKPAINKIFTFLDKNQNQQAVSNEKHFANALACQCPEFDLVRGIANSAKHLQLTRKGSQPNSPTHAANTINQTTGYGKGSYGQGTYGGSNRVMLQGPGGNDRDFSDISRKVFGMWEALSLQHNWQLC